MTNSLHRVTYSNSNLSRWLLLQLPFYRGRNQGSKTSCDNLRTGCSFHLNCYSLAFTATVSTGLIAGLYLETLERTHNRACGQPQASHPQHRWGSEAARQDLDLGRPLVATLRCPMYWCRRETPSGDFSSRTTGPCCRVVTPPSGEAQDEGWGRRVFPSPELQGSHWNTSSFSPS